MDGPEDFGSPVRALTSGGAPPQSVRPAAGKKPRRRRKKKWVPPIPVRYKRRDVTPGPGSYNIGWTHTRTVGQPDWSRPTHGALTRANRGQDTRDFYFGAGMASTSASFGRDSPGPIYQVNAALVHTLILTHRRHTHTSHCPACH